MTNKLDLTDFCREKECPEFIEWDCGFGMCFSCKKVGQSYFVEERPEDCNFLEEIKEHINQTNQTP